MVEISMQFSKGKLLILKQTIVDIFVNAQMDLGGMMRWRSWLRHYATSRKIAGSIPNGVF